MKGLTPAVAAGALLILYGLSSSLLPALPVRADIMVSSAIALGLMAVLVWGLLPLHVLGRRLPLLTVAALPLAVLFVWLGLIPLANVAKVVAAGALGMWIAAELEKLSWIVIVAGVSAVVDIASVAAGPTKAIIGQGPVVVGYFTVAITWFGYTYAEAHTGTPVWA